jgi:hypothetical protein
MSRLSPSPTTPRSVQRWPGAFSSGSAGHRRRRCCEQKPLSHSGARSVHPSQYALRTKSRWFSSGCASLEIPTGRSKSTEDVVAGVSSFGIYPGLRVRRAPIPPTAAEHTFLIRGRGYGAIQHHSKTLVAILCIGPGGHHRRATAFGCWHIQSRLARQLPRSSTISPQQRGASSQILHLSISALKCLLRSMNTSVQRVRLQIGNEGLPAATVTP